MSKFAITCKWHHFAKQLKDISGKIKMSQTEAPDGTSTIEISDGVRADTGPYRYLTANIFESGPMPNP